MRPTRTPRQRFVWRLWLGLFVAFALGVSLWVRSSRWSPAPGWIAFYLVLALPIGAVGAVITRE